MEVSMKVEKIIALAIRYEEELVLRGCAPVRISTQKCFRDCSPEEVLSHARFLAQGMKNIDPAKQYGKLNRHLASLQMCLSFGGLYSLDELMLHNKPDS